MTRDLVVTVADLLPSPEQLANLAYASLSGDPATRRVGGHGRRAIDRPDSTGRSKADTYDAALRPGQGTEYFARMAAEIRSHASSGAWPASRRVMIPKPLGGHRPIDDPAEIRRLAALHVDVVLGDRIDAALTPRQYGGRRRSSYAHLCVRDGATVQDHVATGLQRDIHAGHDVVLVLDLEDAFGLLPRDATLRCLRGIGLDDAAATYVWHLARVRSRHVSGAPVRSDRRRGVEQGGCLSASLLNLVLAPLLRAVEGEHGVHAWAFVDDVYVTLPPTVDPEVLLRDLRSTWRRAGVTNVRPLWSPADGPRSKNSRVVDTTREPLRVLQMYDVDALGISPSPSLVSELRAGGIRRPASLQEVRRASRCMALTRTATRARTGLMGPSEPITGLGRDPGPENTSLSSGEDAQRKEGQVRETREGHRTCTPRSRTSEDRPLERHAACSLTTRPSPPRSHCRGEIPRTAEDGSLGSEESIDLPSPDGDGEPPGGGRPPPVDSPDFFPLDDPAIVKILREGGRLRLGESAKGRRLVLAGLASATDHAMDAATACRVVTSLVRAARRDRRVVVAVDPRERWTRLPTLLGRARDPAYRCVGVVERDGLVDLHLELRSDERPARSSRPCEPPGGDRSVVVHGARLVDPVRRDVRVALDVAGERSIEVIRVEAPVASYAEVEAIATIARRYPWHDIVVPARGSLAVLSPCLQQSSAPAHVGLARSLRALRMARNWTKHGRWLVGRPRP